jgi:fructose-bisphosphate aldolase class II
LGRLKDIRKKVDVPLVIHGGTGFPADMVGDVIRSGVSLFHFGTLMKKVFLDASRESLRGLGHDAKDYQALVGSRKSTDILMSGKTAVRDLVSKYMKMYGSVGMAK